ncbi:2-oxoacid:acceptor oxidoreductase subunit alpha [Candidatus Woesearchaeota archaeon]|jgi:2-oxoglutarate/2-oxoacid ferredoxin oxidoreductase subunit alpha|nr:2-oxoacid:acceptor oxidoreductase subunit alpha [Candidatus Woesearchaeota archaeon]MBT6518426.1 2-oxoacid:acceptor oxidoreductase subunit alpha [Candidatus Woesearchaeota archaeon]MBT7366576.1 2-oxoacid:acceptor oxidoreductase subunit alpha [Candidatus Woesearchaeota archaeon]
MTNLNWLIGGPAGAGIKVTGLILSKTFSRLGLNVFGYTEYPSLARGGHNNFNVHVSKNKKSIAKKLDVLIALDKNTIELHKDKMSSSGIIIYDPAKIENIEFPNIQTLPLPLKEVATECGSALAQNTVALGATMALIGIELDTLNSVIENVFSKKAKIVDVNISAAKKGYELVKEKNISLNCLTDELKEKIEPKLLISGNEAISLGAIQAGCKFYAAYPMTPASSILHFMAGKAREFDFIVKQTEDEIAAINATIGASYAGVRAMTATSGGGFCLMTEGLGLAAESETPIVIVNAMRPGPSTGMPTWTDQSDLRFVSHASQGEFLSVVIAPCDMKDCFYETMNAFNIAENYQIPVIVLTDKLLSESYGTVDELDVNRIGIDRGVIESTTSSYGGKRYLFTDTGVSPRIIPGAVDGIHVATGNEHDEYGEIDASSENRVKMQDKRYRKLESLQKIIPLPKVYGSESGEVGIICWGSTKLSALDAQEKLEKLGYNVGVVCFKYILPFPDSEDVRKILKRFNKLIMVEANYTGQFLGMFRENLLIDVDDKLLKYDGRPIYPEEIVEKVKSVLSGGENNG